MLLDSLLRFYQDDPDDPFNVYALAIEYQKTDLKQSGRYFDMLLDKHPDYLPTYYHAAGLFAQLADLDKASQIYKRGIELASHLKNAKAQRELQGAYQQFRDDMED
jgi:tetratricopeptide (TPR) repeat protein